jgi:hypothetical protein
LLRSEGEVDVVLENEVLHTIIESNSTF